MLLNRKQKTLSSAIPTSPASSTMSSSPSRNFVVGPVPRSRYPLLSFMDMTKLGLYFSRLVILGQLVCFVILAIAIKQRMISQPELATWVSSMVQGGSTAMIWDDVMDFLQGDYLHRFLYPDSPFTTPGKLGNQNVHLVSCIGRRRSSSQDTLDTWTSSSIAYAAVEQPVPTISQLISSLSPDASYTKYMTTPCQSFGAPYTTTAAIRPGRFGGNIVVSGKAPPQSVIVNVVAVNDTNGIVALQEDVGSLDADVFYGVWTNNVFVAVSQLTQRMMTLVAEPDSTPATKVTVQLTCPDANGNKQICGLGQMTSIETTPSSPVCKDATITVTNGQPTSYFGAAYNEPVNIAIVQGPDAYLKVPAPKTVVETMLSSARRNEWLGNTTSMIYTFGVMVNMPNKILIGYSSMWVMQSTGKIQYKNTVDTLPLCGMYHFDQSKDGSMLFLMVLNLVLFTITAVLMILAILLKFLPKVDLGIKIRFSGVDIFFEIIQQSLFWAAVGVFVNFVNKVQTMSPCYVDPSLTAAQRDQKLQQGASLVAQLFNVRDEQQDLLFLLSMNIIAVFIRFFNTLPNTSYLSLLPRLLVAASNDLFHFSIAFVIFILAYATSGFVLFSQLLPQFQSVGVGFRTLITIILSGDVMADSFQSTYPDKTVVPTIFYISFGIVSIFCLANIFISILSVSFGVIKDQLDNTGFSVLEVIMRKLGFDNMIQKGNKTEDEATAKMMARIRSLEATQTVTLAEVREVSRILSQLSGYRRAPGFGYSAVGDNNNNNNNNNSRIVPTNNNNIINTNFVSSSPTNMVVPPAAVIAAPNVIYTTTPPNASPPMIIASTTSPSSPNRNEEHWNLRQDWANRYALASPNQTYDSSVC